tara:strand:+ start:272 stop:421 length:150 start_codon:yes stop_codon:yes gene_type:complete
MNNFKKGDKVKVGQHLIVDERLAVVHAVGIKGTATIPLRGEIISTTTVL